MPKLLPAPGYTFEGIHGETNGPQTLIGTWITLSLAIIAVLLRMIVKCFIVPRPHLEDYFAIAAVLLSIARTIMLTICESATRQDCVRVADHLIKVTIDHQFGQHIWDVAILNFGFLYTVCLVDSFGMRRINNGRPSGPKARH